MSTTTTLHPALIASPAKSDARADAPLGFLRRFLDRVVAARQAEAERIVARYLADVGKADIIPPASGLASRRSN